MPIYKATWAFPSVSAKPEDEVTWNTHFSAADDVTAILAHNFMALLVNNPPAGVGGDVLGQWLSNSLASMTTKIYRVGAPAGSGPISLITNIPIPARANANDLPGETAVCLSFKDEAVGVSADAAHRGRMFIGPFNFAAIDGTNRPGLVSQSMINTMRDAAKELFDDWQSVGVDWVIRSAGGNRLVVSGWIDREPDYMGKRGLRTAARTTWAF